MWPIQLPHSFIFLLYAGYSSPPWLYAMIFSIPLHYHISKFSYLIPKTPKFQHLAKLYSKRSTLLVSFFKFVSTLLVKRIFLLFNAAFALTILDLIALVHLASFVIMLPKQLRCSTFCSCFWCIIVCTGKGCLGILITLIFSHIHSHSIASSGVDYTFSNVLAWWFMALEEKLYVYRAFLN